jgi:hypothetical protein
MDLRPAEPRQDPVGSWSQPSGSLARRVAELRHAASGAVRFAGALHGATATGEAARRHLSVRVGLWLDEAGWVRQARWRAADDAPLRAVAEAACSLIESGADPHALDEDALVSAAALQAGDDRAALVAAAIAAALLAAGQEP